MANNHQNDHDGDEDGEREYHEDHNRRSSDHGWGLTPQSTTAFIGILGMLAATFWTLSDYRITVSNMEQRLNAHSERMADYERRLSDIDKNGTRGLATTELNLKALQKEVDDLVDILKESPYMKRDLRNIPYNDLKSRNN